MEKSNSIVYRLKNSASKERILCLLFSFLISFFVLLITSTVTSPLYGNNYGWDQSVFMVVGKGWTQGLVPYCDLFDHKGPWIYLINAIGFGLFDNKLGIFFIQILLMTVNLFFVYKTARLLWPIRYAVTSVLVFLLVFSVYYGGGDLTEEFSIPFLIVPLYCFMSFSSKNNSINTHKYLYSFIYGVCFSIHLLNRINNAAIVVGIILSCFVFCLREKAFLKLLINSIAFIVGVVIILAPVLIYFYCNNALYDFFYANFLFNFSYSSGGLSFSYEFFISIAIAVIIVLSTVFLSHKGEKRNYMYIGITVISVISSLTLCVGNGYAHYFMIYIPIIPVAFCLTLNALEIAINGKKKSTLCIAFVIMCLIAIGPHYKTLYRYPANVIKEITHTNAPETLNIDKVLSTIPKSERDKVLAYNVSPSFYLKTGIMPCHRFFSNQSFHKTVSQAYNEELCNYLTNTPPKWLVVYKDDYDEDFLCILQQQYEYVIDVENAYEKVTQLYRIK